MAQNDQSQDFLILKGNITQKNFKRQTLLNDEIERISEENSSKGSDIIQVKKQENIQLQLSPDMRSKRKSSFNVFNKSKTLRNFSRQYSRKSRKSRGENEIELNSNINLQSSFYIPRLSEAGDEIASSHISITSKFITFLGKKNETMNSIKELKCIYCRTIKPEMETLDCDHIACKECLINLIKYRVKQKQILELKCIICDQVFQKNFIKQYLNDELFLEYLKLTNFSKRVTTIREKETTNCPFCNELCLNPILRRTTTMNHFDSIKANNSLKCDLTKSPTLKYVIRCANDHEFCFLCKQQPHPERLCKGVSSTINNLTYKNTNRNNLNNEDDDDMVNCVECGWQNNTKKLSTYICEKCESTICMLCLKKADLFHYYDIFSYCYMSQFISLNSPWLKYYLTKFLRNIIVTIIWLIILLVLGSFYYIFWFKSKLLKSITKKGLFKKVEHLNYFKYFSILIYFNISIYTWILSLILTLLSIIFYPLILLIYKAKHNLF